MDNTSSIPSVPIIPKHREYLIENILPARELHLIAGPSGAGKTTWLMQMIKQWEKGESIFGHRSHPMPFVYVVLDRSADGTRRTFERVGVRDDFPLWTPTRQLDKAPLTTILDTVRRQHPDARVFFVEGIASKVPMGKIMDYGVVSGFLKELTHYCHDHDVTITGIAHSAKTKADESYENPRQRVVGSVAWAGFSETIIIVEPKNPDNPTDTTRQLFLLPRNYKEQAFTLDFENGLLKPAMPKLNRSQQLLTYLSALTPNVAGIILTSLEEIRKAVPMPESTLFAEIDKLKKEKVLEGTAPGRYRVHSKPN